MRRLVLSAITLLALVPGSSIAAEYSLKRLGLADALHTRNDGYQSSVLSEGVAAGYSVGVSTAYQSGSEFGRSGWWSNGNQIVRVGLFDDEHRGNEFWNLGAYSSAALGVNRNGVAVGGSLSYTPHAGGHSAWKFDGQSVTRLGFLDAEHRGDDGQTYTQVLGSWLNDAGDIVGYSTRYAGQSSSNVRTAWIYRGGQYTTLGLTGPEFLFLDGKPDAEPVGLNEAGQVIGTSWYSNGIYGGQLAWRSDGVTTEPVGLVTPDNLSESLWKWSFAEQINEAGQVVGGADIGPPFSQPYHDAVWISDGAATQRIGLYGDGYVYSPSGANQGRAIALSAGGHVIGRSVRWNDAVPRGIDAWVYHDGTTTQLGYTEGAFTSSSGFRSSFTSKVSDAGHVVGSSTMYAGEDSNGTALWLYDGEETIRLGLNDAAHTSSSGQQLSKETFLLPNGDVGGYSRHYNGSVGDGATWWYFDYSEGVTHEVAFVASPSPTSIYGSLTMAEVDGFAYGHTLENAETLLAEHDLYRWTSELGRESLTPLVEPNDELAMFAGLGTIMTSESTGLLFGRGGLSAGGTAPFRLDPVRSPDFNGDGMVDAADYAVWRNGLGTDYTLIDYANWRKHYGESMDGGAFSRANSSVPEPATWIAVATILAALTSTEARRRSL